MYAETVINGMTKLMKPRARIVIDLEEKTSSNIPYGT